MIDGLWTLIFSSGSFAGGGVAYLQGGVITGGDGQYYYLGQYSQDDSTKTFRATLDVRAFVPSAVTVFGLALQQFSLVLEGRITEDTASAVGTLPQIPGVLINVKMVRRWKRPALMSTT